MDNCFFSESYRILFQNKKETFTGGFVIVSMGIRA